jgi:translation elongation factor EF-Tu-like GTPase
MFGHKRAHRMFEWLRKKPVTLPADAELALTAGRVLWLRSVWVVGRVECDELRLGDEVVAVSAAPLCRARITNLEQFQRSLESARRGEEVAIMFSRWERDSLPQDVRLFRVSAQSRAEPVAAPDCCT